MGVPQIKEELRTRLPGMKVRFGAALLTATALTFLFASGSWAQKRQPLFPGGSFCDDVNSGLCTDLARGVNYEGQYSGHDEPSLLFYSNKPGSGNTSVYYLRLPKDPKAQPVQGGTNGVTWN